MFLKQIKIKPSGLKDVTEKKAGSKLVDNKAAARVWKDAHNAYHIFARWHPRWRESLIDEYFIETRFIPLLLNAQPGDGTAAANVTPFALAEAWCNQIGVPLTDPNRLLHEVEPVMSDLLKLYALAQNQQEE